MLTINAFINGAARNTEATRGQRKLNSTQKKTTLGRANGFVLRLEKEFRDPFKEVMGSLGFFPKASYRNEGEEVLANYRKDQIVITPYQNKLSRIAGLTTNSPKAPQKEIGDFSIQSSTNLQEQSVDYQARQQDKQIAASPDHLARPFSTDSLNQLLAAGFNLKGAYPVLGNNESDFAVITLQGLQPVYLNAFTRGSESLTVQQIVEQANSISNKEMNEFQGSAGSDSEPGIIPVEHYALSLGKQDFVRAVKELNGSELEPFITIAKPTKTYYAERKSLVQASHRQLFENNNDRLLQNYGVLSAPNSSEGLSSVHQMFGIVGNIVLEIDCWDGSKGRGVFPAINGKYANYAIREAKGLATKDYSLV